ncbi:MAG: hypothetical protein R3C68_02775 [Myxococcota bacterium]
MVLSNANIAKDRMTVTGASKGGELSNLLGPLLTRNPQTQGRRGALSLCGEGQLNGSDAVWQGIGPTNPQDNVSSWQLGPQPLAFRPYDAVDGKYPSTQIRFYHPQ